MKLTYTPTAYAPRGVGAGAIPAAAAQADELAEMRLENELDYVRRDLRLLARQAGLLLCHAALLTGNLDDLKLEIEPEEL